MNLHDPYAERPCMEEWRWRLTEFSQIPLPKTKEEITAKREEELTVLREKKKQEIIERRIRLDAERQRRLEAAALTLRTPRALPDPIPFHFKWQKYFWASNRGERLF